MSKSNKSKSQERREAVTNNNKSKVEARPIGEGKDPLAEGEKLHNPTNTTGETHYEADSSELDAEREAAKNRIGGQDADARAEEHNAESPTAPDNVPETATANEQETVAAGRVEPGSEVNDTPENVDVPERSEEQENADSEERQDAVETALETTDKP